jgi:hypothetical protein
VRTAGVVVPPPVLDHDLGLRQRVEDLAVEQLVAELAVEALAVAVLPRAAGLDVGRLGADGGRSTPNRLDVDRAQLAVHSDRQITASR